MNIIDIFQTMIIKGKSFFVTLTCALFFTLELIAWDCGECAFPLQMGISTSAYQIEGDFNGKDFVESNWSEFISKNSLPENKYGIGHWENYREHIKEVAGTGVKYYRFSFEWSKIEPQPKQFDDQVVQHYKNLLAEIKLQGLTPVFTFHHFSEPKWFYDLGGFTQESNIDYFVDYADFLIDNILQDVEYFITFNEPTVYAIGGYLSPLFPPGQLSFKMYYKVILHTLKAHAKLYQLIKKRKGERAQVGLAHHIRPIEPWNTRWVWNHWLAQFGDYSFNQMVFTALSTGEFKIRIPGVVRISESLPELIGTQDFIGLNYYSRDHIRLNLSTWPIIEIGAPHHLPKTGMEWEIYPEGLSEAIDTVQAHFPTLPIIITENGAAFEEPHKQVEFIHDHLMVLKKKLTEGANIKAYFLWSLWDNYEWVGGFSKRFGLISLDTEQPHYKPSYYWFKNTVTCLRP